MAEQGRPTKYDPAYCELVVEDAAKGYSLSAFAGGILVSRDTITEWRRVHPDFDQACATAKVVRARYLETGMMDMGVPAPAMNARKFALVNCAPDDWREPKQVLEHTGADGGPVQHEAKLDVTGLTDDQLRALSSIRVPGK